MKSKPKMKTSPLLLIAFVFVVIASVLAYYPGYNIFYDSLSDLGLFSNFFNFSLIVSGICLGIFTLNELDKKHFSQLCRMSFLFTSICLMFIGIITKEYFAHCIVAIGFFFLFPVSLLLLSKELKNKNKIVSRASLIISRSLLIVLFLGVFVWSLIFKIGLAIPEIIALIFCVIWIFIIIVHFK